MVQNINFSLIGQNSDLSLKLNFTRQHESKDMFSFQKRASDVKILKFHVNQDNSAYPRKCIFNRISFVNSDTAIGFVALKQFREWSQILISNLN